MEHEPQPVSQVRGMLRVCCSVPANLQLLRPQSVESRHGMLTKQCRLCGRKHYELVVDPGLFGVHGGRM